MSRASGARRAEHLSAGARREVVRLAAARGVVLPANVRAALTRPGPLLLDELLDACAALGVSPADVMEAAGSEVAR